MQLTVVIQAPAVIIVAFEITSIQRVINESPKNPMPSTLIAIGIRNLPPDIIDEEEMVTSVEMATLVDMEIRATTMVPHTLLYSVGSQTATKQQSILRLERFTVSESRTVVQCLVRIMTEPYSRTTHA